MALTQHESDLDRQHGLDPFLIAHRSGHGEFNMSGKYSPAAVRDQINRAVAIVERASMVGLLTPTSRVLIKGNGAAGIAAAMRAANSKVQSVTLSHNTRPAFDRQRNSSRIIDPVEYDWPAEGWQTGDNAPTGRIPLPYKRGRAKDVVEKIWDKAWTRFQVENPVRLIDNLTAAAAPAGTFDFVLDCTGPGNENTKVGNYCWYEFWRDDDLETPHLGFDDKVNPTVLISGGADGALQDFLRIIFPGKTPRDIYLSLGLTDAQRLRVEWEILNAEDRAKRAWVWSASSGIDCRVLAQLHERHRAVATALVPVVRKKLEKLLESTTTTLANVWLAHGCTHFGPSYAFNRFLALLVDEFCKTTDIGTRLHGGRKLTRLEGEGKHVCDGAIENCLNHRHHPTFEASHCRQILPTPDSELPGAFDIIVVRHGLDGSVRRLSRQSLPYELPIIP